MSMIVTKKPDPFIDSLIEQKNANYLLIIFYGTNYTLILSYLTKVVIERKEKNTEKHACFQIIFSSTITQRLNYHKNVKGYYCNTYKGILKPY